MFSRFDPSPQLKIVILGITWAVAAAVASVKSSSGGNGSRGEPFCCYFKNKFLI
jgi:hypothetical protein